MLGKTGLLVKLTLVFTVLLAVISSLPFVITYTATREALMGVFVVLSAFHLLVVRDLRRIIDAAGKGEPSGVERGDEIGRLAELLKPGKKPGPGDD